MTLTVRGLSAGHDGTDVVHDVDLDVATGEVVAVIGSNGAGKTTLLQALCGLLPTTAGTIRLDDRDVTGVDTVGLARRGIAFVPADRHLFPRMTVAENLALGAYPRRPDATAVAEVHRLFPRLAERATQRAGTLSGGEQQMLAIGRALVGGPRLLVLDEPTTGLAPRLAAEAFAALGELRRRGTTILVAEQQVVLALGLADRGCVLDEGRVVLTGPAASLAADARVRRAYLGVD